MNASEFNEIYENKVCIPLQNIGFIRKGNSLFLHQGNIYLVLIQNCFRSERVARFLLCLRHSFTRDLYDKTNNLFELNTESYPFRVKPFSLCDSFLSTWHYETYSVQDWHYNKINYGQTEEIYGGIDDVSQKCDLLRTNIEKYYFAWMNMLSPEKALFQLKKYNSGWKLELDWIEDYEQYIKSNKSNKLVNLIDRFR